MKATQLLLLMLAEELVESDQLLDKIDIWLDHDFITKDDAADLEKICIDFKKENQ
jgi:hypothetical protein